MLFFCTVSVSALTEPGEGTEGLPVVSDPSITLVKVLYGPDGEEGYGFGSPVSILEDVAIVGAPLSRQDGLDYAGACYIFEKDEGGKDNWGMVSKITSPEPRIGEGFGYDISVSGDYAIINAPGIPISGFNSSIAVYIFKRDTEGNWKPVAKLTSPDPNPFDGFGNSISISGDYAIVGAYWTGYSYNVTEKQLKNASPSYAYIFKKDEGGEDNWGLIARLNASEQQNKLWFGSSVSISGGYAIVGAKVNDYTDIFNSRAYIFKKDDGGEDNWGKVAIVNSTNPKAVEWFGGSVLISGDYAAVYSRLDHEDDVFYSGAIYLFKKNESGEDNWEQVARIKASNVYNVSGLTPCAFIGDYLIASSAGASPGGIYDAGAVYVFRKDEGGKDNWGQVACINGSEPRAWFGDTSVSEEYAIAGSGGNSSRKAFIYKFNYDFSPETTTVVTENETSTAPTIPVP